LDFCNTNEKGEEMKRASLRYFFAILLASAMTINLHCSLAAEISFTAASLGAPTGNFAAVAAGDIDNDGYAEILSGRRDGQAGLFLFTYTGGMWMQQQVTPDGEYGGVALADVTGDGILEQFRRCKL
jgi:hypothetical protein